MTAREKLAEQAEALSKASADLVKHCETAIAAIDAAEARRAESTKRQMAIIDGMFAAIEAVHKPKDHPVGIAFTEGVGIREVKP